MENFGISHVKLPFLFDVDKLERELSVIINSEWVSHFNTYGYNGNWKSVALYSFNGEKNNIHVAITRTELKETVLLKKTPYFKEVISSFRAPLLSVRLLKLDKGSVIKPHKDFNLGYADGTIRIHIPIITNKDVVFLLKGERIVMNQGECWYTNVNYTHSVENQGNTDRVHLVIDLERNKWTDDLFFSLTAKEDFFPKTSQNYDKETVIRMIDELQNQSSLAAKELIVTLKKQLEN